MDIITITRIIAFGGLAVGVLGILLRLGEIMRRPFNRDLARSRGNTRRSLLYAFTLGMAPWEKESTRIHWLAYIRGILFHVGIFTAFAMLFLSPWLDRLPSPIVWALAAVSVIGGLFGFAGVYIRLTEESTRALTLPDDYFSLLLTSLFATLAAFAPLSPVALSLFYLTTGLLGVYIPFSKIRHCVYFFYSKFFFGLGFGYRGVIGQAPSDYAD